MTATALNPALSVFPTIGYMPMPADFPYKKIMQMGRPRHEKFSDFGIRHPSMPCSRRAKIFAPFDALAGFSDRINKKETLYEEKKVLSEEEKTSLGRKLTYLTHLFIKAKYRKNPFPEVSVTFFEPCTDLENDAFGTKGLYKNITGTVNHIDLELRRHLAIDGRVLDVEDLIGIDILLSRKIPLMS